MSETLGTCRLGSFPHQRHNEYCEDWQAVPTPKEQPTEMTSLREIKAKLDTLAESQGKLLKLIGEFEGRARWMGVEGKINSLEQGLDKLMQSHAALGKQMTTLTVSVAALNANHKFVATQQTVIDLGLKVEGLMASLNAASAQNPTGMTLSQRMDALGPYLVGLSGQVKGLGDGLADVREDLLAAKLVKTLAKKPKRKARRA